MGKKITVDSATLMNKGFEAIEIMNLFSLPQEKVQIVIHPQSLIHSAVEYADGAILAEMSEPDMRIPIQYAVTYPKRLPSPVKPLNTVLKRRSWNFLSRILTAFRAWTWPWRPSGAAACFRPC